MNKYIVLSLSALVIFFTSCTTTKRQYPTSNYQCEKTGEIFEISNTINEENLICPDKTCGGKLVKVASYRRFGSGLNTRYGYSDPWRVGYSGPYVNRRNFFGMGFHSGHHHHHYYHDDKRSKSGSSKPKNIPQSRPNFPRPSAKNVSNSNPRASSNSGSTSRSSSSSNSSPSKSSSSGGRANFPRPSAKN